MKNREPEYKEAYLHSSNLIVPHETYQRELNVRRVNKIAKEFDEKIANEPKVSFRDGKYYVFDGQHTIAARKKLNHNRDLVIKCKVYYGMTASDEATLFAQQFGSSARLTAGFKMRALIYAGDPNAMRFLKATESIGLRLDFNQAAGKKRIGCINTAFTEFLKSGEENYKETMNIITEAWNGVPESYRRENVLGISRFVNEYYGEYERKRLIKHLKRVDPLQIYRDGKAMGTTLQGYKKYMYQVFLIYNNGNKKKALEMKF